MSMMSRVLGVPKSGFYAWANRKPSARVQRVGVLAAKIRKAHQASKGIYGAPRLQADLRAEGVHMGKKRVARPKRLRPHQTLSIGTSFLRISMSYGLPISPIFQPGLGFYIWPSYSMRSAAKSLAGPWL